MTADCGTSSAPRSTWRASRGIDVLVTDHHHAATWPAGGRGGGQPRARGQRLPGAALTGAGVAWKVAHLLLGELARGGAWRRGRRGVATAGRAAAGVVRELADLALIGTVADVAPILGENRSIARLGLEQLRAGPRPGLAALLERAGLARDALDLETSASRSRRASTPPAGWGRRRGPRGCCWPTDRRRGGRAGRGDRDGQPRPPRDDAHRRSPRPGASWASAGHVGRAGRGRRRPAPTPRRSRPARPARPRCWSAGSGRSGSSAWSRAASPRIWAGRPWSRPRWTPEAGTLRASCRSGGGVNLAEALIACDDLLIRHGGHRAAAGLRHRGGPVAGVRRPLPGDRRGRGSAAGPPELAVDLVLPADSVDYALVREIGLLAPTGPGNPLPTWR